jgi:hypothetical protein
MLPGLDQRSGLLDFATCAEAVELVGSACGSLRALFGRALDGQESRTKRYATVEQRGGFICGVKSSHDAVNIARMAYRAHRQNGGERPT